MARIIAAVLVLLLDVDEARLVDPNHASEGKSIIAKPKVDWSPGRDYPSTLDSHTRSPRKHRPAPAEVSPEQGYPSDPWHERTPTAREHRIATRKLSEYAKHVRKHENFFDTFFFVYWGSLLVVFLVALFIGFRADAAAEVEAKKRAQEQVAMTQTDSGRPGRSQSVTVAGTWGRRAAKQDTRSLMVLDMKKALKLPENMWTLNLVSCVGQAKTKREWNIPFPLVAAATLVMGCLQFLCITLIVHDLDPMAKPVTEIPTAEWKTDPWTVNCMKILMASYISIHAVEEGGQVRQALAACLVVSHKRLRYSRGFPMFLLIFQYLIAVFVIWAGISAVLSLNNVPSILYSSMAIMFLVNIDETVYKFFYQVFDIEADFEVIHADSAHENDNLHKDEEMEHGQFHWWVEVLLKTLILFLLFWGIFVIARAWRTNVMPTDRVHVISDVLFERLLPAP